MAIESFFPARLLEYLTDLMPAPTAYLLVYLYAKSRERNEDRIAIAQVKLGILTGMTRDAVRRSLSKLKKLGFVSLKSSDGRTIIHIHNIYKMFKDRSSYSHETPKKEPESVPPPQTPPITSKTGIESLFNSLWEQYPRKLGMKKAMTHFRASVRNGEDEKDIVAALKNYLLYLQRESVGLQYTQHGATWFYNWRDWIPEVRPPANSEPPVKPKPPEPEPEPTMTLEEMQEIRKKNLPQTEIPQESPKQEPTVPAEDVNELVMKLAGGSRRPK